MTTFIVIMGVAGCGKSSLGRTLAQAQSLPLIEGDDFHSTNNRAKMSQGIALTDDDRAGWLDTLVQQLTMHPQGVVLTCSALKRAYRDRLRQACPMLLFAFLEISREAAQARVLARAHEHFFSTKLVDSQFATLEVPSAEPGVLTLDATLPLTHLQTQVSDWLQTLEAA